MARKFIISDNKFLYGNVMLHMELIPRSAVTTNSSRTIMNGHHRAHAAEKAGTEVSEFKVLGGGRWHTDNENKILYLWGASTDFGYAEPEQIKRAIQSPETWISLSMEGWQIKHSPIIMNDLPELNTFTDLMLVP